MVGEPTTLELFPPGMLAGAALAVDAVACRVSATLSERAIPSIVLRGPGISDLLYDGPARRWYDDIDLLVPPSRVMAAENVLDALGFKRRFPRLAPGEREPHSREWIESDRGIAVDLHLTIVGVGVEPQRLWDELAATAERLALPAGELAVPSTPARAIVALHAASSWSPPRQTTR